MQAIYFVFYDFNSLKLLVVYTECQQSSLESRMLLLNQYIELEVFERNARIHLTLTYYE